MIICDIDGCLFDNNHRKHLIPENKEITNGWVDFNQACANDNPVFGVINIVKTLSIVNATEIVFLTSRGESARFETEKQLSNIFYNDYTLIMRPMTDNRTSEEFKHDEIKKLSSQFNDQSIIIDDHKGVIKMCKEKFPMLSTILVKSHDCTISK